MPNRYNPPPNWPQPPAGWTPPPGWQPDPAWGPPPPGWQLWLQEKDATPGPLGWVKRHKALTVIGALLVLVLIGALLPDSDDSDPDVAANDQETSAPVETSDSPTPKTTTAKPPASPVEELRAAVLKAIGKSNRKGVKRLTVKSTGAAGKPIAIKFASNENLTTGLTKDTLRLDIVKALEAVRKNADWRYSEVQVTATYSLVDKLGNATEDVVARAEYPRATVENINFENFRFKDVFDIAGPDQAFVHPAFQY